MDQKLNICLVKTSLPSYFPEKHNVWEKSINGLIKICKELNVNLNIIQESYSDAACTTLASTAKNAFPYTMSFPGNHLDLAAPTRFQTPHDSDTVDLYNNNAVYGYTDWQLNVEKEIDTNQAAIYTIVKMPAADQLCLGQSDLNNRADGSSSDKRHKIYGECF